MFQLATLALTAGMDAAVFGAAVSAAHRPLSSVSVSLDRDVARTGGRDLLVFTRVSPSPPAPFMPMPPTPPAPLSPLAPLKTWLDGMHDVMTAQALTTPYGDAERDAMIVIAILAALASLMWVRIVCALAAPNIAERGRMLVVAVCACALQGVLLGGVLPTMGVITSTGSFAANVVSTEPGALVILPA